MKLIRSMATAAGIGLLSMSCYTLQPSTAAEPATGTRLAFAINDVGRVALGGTMGPEILRVEGNLQSKEGDEYVVGVAGVELLQGGYQTWAGETVRIKSSYVSAVYEKKFSPGKTALAVGGLAVAATLIGSKGLPSFVDFSRDGEGGTVMTRRGRIPPSMHPGLPPFLRSINPPRSH